MKTFSAAFHSARKEKFPTSIVLITILVYQSFLSPLLGPSCRFYPSCSDYSYQALARYGLVKGLYLSIRRLLRCHPYHPGGIDPVP